MSLKIMTVNRMLSLVMSGILLTGCAIGPSYQKPHAESKEEKEQKFIQPTTEGESIANLPWWDVFKDENLKFLIKEALENNQDLKGAVARIAAARAILTSVKADNFPDLSIEGGGVRGSASQKLVIPLAGVPVNNFYAGGRIFYEADLWGKIRRASESSRADVVSTEEDRRALTISLVAEVASTYFLLTSLDDRLETAKQTTQSRRESLDLVKIRFKGGIVSELDVHQAGIQEAVSSALIPSYERRIAQTENALSILTGQKPGPITRTKFSPDAKYESDIPAGLPSELLERRPDILASSERLHGQMARIGVAQSYRLPTITLTAAGGFESSEFEDWFVEKGQYWNGGVALTMPLLDWGRTGGQVSLEKARTEEALLQYQKAVLVALQEVEDGLIAVKTYRDEVAAIKRQVEIAQAATRLSRIRYKGGVSSYLEVLEADRARFTAELLFADVRFFQTNALIELYKALGGGWNPQ